MNIDPEPDDPDEVRGSDLPSYSLREATLHLRRFPSGATRDAMGSKIEYARHLDPAVLHEFAAYMHRHQVMEDGTIRAPDDWKKGIPNEVYLDSLARHFWSLWLRFEDSPTPTISFLDDLSAILFNTMGMMRNILQSRKEP